MSCVGRKYKYIIDFYPLIYKVKQFETYIKTFLFFFVVWY